jgi:hypothetical protein
MGTGFYYTRQGRVMRFASLDEAKRVAMSVSDTVMIRDDRDGRVVCVKWGYGKRPYRKYIK